MFPVFALIALGINIFLPHPLLEVLAAGFILLQISIQKFQLFSDETALMWIALLVLAAGFIFPIGEINIAFWIVAAHVTIHGVKQL